MLMINLFEKHTIKSLVVLMVCFIDGCLFNKEYTQNNIKGIKIVYNLPILKLDGELLNITDSFSVFYFKDLVLYKIPYKLILENSKAIESIEVRFNYFIYRKNSEFGYYYDTLKLIKEKRFSVDSFLTLKAFRGFNFYDRKNDSIVGRRILLNGDIVESYLPRIRYDQSYGDTTFLYYTDRFKGVDYSFSKELDSVKNLKVFKVRIAYASQFYTGYQFKFPKREYLFEMKEVASKDYRQPSDL